MQLVRSPEVLAAGTTSLVALESTLVAHGLPWPANLEVARALEDTVRRGGAVPATIAIVDGAPHVGLAPEVLDGLARDGARFAKAGATDLAVHLARGSSAATTVSATMLIGARAGIRVFATGGIGGVHRGTTDDVSRDLLALATIPMIVVSAGVKAILDLPRTLEHLETLGVLVIGVGTDELPAFYTRSSGLRLDHRVDDLGELAQIARRHWEIGGGGILACNPIPEAAALDRGMIDAAIARALGEADAAGISGKRLTPFLLAALAAITGDASIAANRALALHNAAVAAELAVQLATV